MKVVAEELERLMGPIDTRIQMNDSGPTVLMMVGLQGSGKTEIAFSYINDRGDVFKRTHPFEGIIPNMERRYRDTDS